MTEIPLLSTETREQLPPQRLLERTRIIEALMVVPDDALLRLQYFQPQVGCFNACRFCSQEAGTMVWQLSQESMEDFIAALAHTAQSRGITIASGRTTHRQRVLFPYLDNDIFSYSHLDTYIRHVHDDLGATVRLASVGWSRRNEALNSMHRKIADELWDKIAGIRISITPYTAGWAAESGLKMSRSEYEEDLAHAVTTYMPAMRRLGFGRETAAIEMRFPPHVERTEVRESFVGGHHVIATGPYVLVRVQSGEEPLSHTFVSTLDGRRPVFSHAPAIYRMLTSDEYVAQNGWEWVAVSMLDGTMETAALSRDVPVYRFENRGGSYYAIDPLFSENGEFHALHVYPETETRAAAGYVNATRYFLNTLIEFKRRRGIARREPVPNATWNDVASILDELTQHVDTLSRTDTKAALHLSAGVIPLVASTIRILKTADVVPNVFFQRGFLIDTGQIVNQGRAKNLFKGLAVHEDDPMTPLEATAYGNNSVSTERGRVWRIVPMPFAQTGVHRTIAGGKSLISDTLHTIAVHEVSDMTLRPTDARTGDRLQSHVISGVAVEAIHRAQGWSQYLQPGLQQQEPEHGSL